MKSCRVPPNRRKAGLRAAASVLILRELQRNLRVTPMMHCCTDSSTQFTLKNARKYSRVKAPKPAGFKRPQLCFTLIFDLKSKFWNYFVVTTPEGLRRITDVIVFKLVNRFDYKHVTLTWFPFLVLRLWKWFYSWPLTSGFHMQRSVLIISHPSCYWNRRDFGARVYSRSTNVSDSQRNMNLSLAVEIQSSNLQQFYFRWSGYEGQQVTRVILRSKSVCGSRVCSCLNRNSGNSHADSGNRSETWIDSGSPYFSIL